MSSRRSLLIVPAILSAVLGSCAPAAKQRTIDQRILGAVESVPLTVSLLDRIRLEPHEIPIALCVARRLSDAPEWMAVEGYFVTVPPDTTTMYDYAGLLALEAAGGLTEESRLAVYPKRALVRGDSARVSRLIKANKVNWHYAWSDPAPRHVIIDASGASCAIDTKEPRADASDSSGHE